MSVTGTSPVPTGKVQLMDGSTVVASGVLSGGATILSGTFAVGTHVLSAHYGGDATHGAADSAALKEVIVPGGTCSRTITPPHRVVP